ncbi:alpha-ketoglutarate transporter [Neokomagataea thailandica NBRC 106555]|uniref:MFS transporter n=2 Tax=Neokomagataea TaxID=1223423 RepID=A0A4Y6V2B1_9PROT|nr:MULTISPECIES: MFS transporter [Neokomagataea]QDH24182.1 MFS transporter [Neokomagataea tanensis]GBR52723.1 alpha-ketoglutarate transporter [Neokomagataea thailandica NBRC 106555]
MSTSTAERRGLAEILGIPPALFWAFVGQLLFMVGDGVEAGYLDTFMLHNGHTQDFVTNLFIYYGITVMIAAWFSGPLSDLLGPKKVMWIGLILWAVLEVGFLLFGLGPNNGPMITLFYTLRGFAYPLFAYGFLVWIAAATPAPMLGSAAGWFWFSFSAGLPTLGSQFARYAIPAIGELNTFWCSLGLVILGGLIALLFTHEPTGKKRLLPEHVSTKEIFFGSLSIVWREPKTLIAGIVRIIDTSSEYAFLAIMPAFFVDHLHFTQGQWLDILSIIFLSNILFNLVSGMVADTLGHRFVVAVFGGIGGFVSIPLFYYVPLWLPGNFWAVAAAGVLYGASVAAFVPLSGLMPQICPREKAAALSILGLGAGASTWVGPAIVAGCASVFGPGLHFVIWTFAVIYLLSALGTLTLTISPEARRYTEEMEARGESTKAVGH